MPIFPFAFGRRGCLVAGRGRAVRNFEVNVKKKKVKVKCKRANGRWKSF